MSSPILWIIFPAGAGILLWFLRRRTAWMILLACGLCLALAALAWLMPLGELVRIGPLSFEVETTLGFAGRTLELANSDRAFLTFIFLLCAFWFIGSYPAGANNLLIPFGLGIVSLLIAALAVEPFLYAALLVEMAVLLAVPMLAPPGKKFSQGVLRFLIFQTLAMPFILLAGWALAGVEANPSNQTLVELSTALLALGFAFWLAVFPFYTWIPLLAEQSFPYVSGFVLLVLPTINLLLGQSFLTRFGWLHSSLDVYLVIGQIGTLMVVTAGIWAAFQKDLARLFGYFVIVETGFSLLAASLNSPIGEQLFASMFLPRMMGLGVWALALSVLRREVPSTRFEHVQGISQRMPYASIALAVASLSMAGLPILAIFPIRQVLMEELARQSFFTALWALAGTVGMLFSTFRALAVISRGRSIAQTVCESRFQIFLLITGSIGLLLVGIFPQVFLPMLQGLVSSYTPSP